MYSRHFDLNTLLRRTHMVTPLTLVGGSLCLMLGALWWVFRR